MKKTIGYTCGTFDLFHVGHLNILKNAKEHCDYLIVGIHKDASYKNIETFISFEERTQIVESIKYVDEVILACKEHTEVYDLIKFDYLFVGSDWKGSPRYEKYEKELGAKGVKIIYFPYTKQTSSTQLRALIDKGK